MIFVLEWDSIWNLSFSTLPFSLFGLQHVYTFSPPSHNMSCRTCPLHILVSCSILFSFPSNLGVYVVNLRRHVLSFLVLPTWDWMFFYKPLASYHAPPITWNTVAKQALFLPNGALSEHFVVILRTTSAISQITCLFKYLVFGHDLAHSP